MPGETKSPGPLFDPRRSPLRERQLSAVEQEGCDLIDALLEDLDSTGLSDTEIADRSATDRAHMSRVRSKQAHPPQSLVAFGVDHSRHRPPHYLVAVNRIAAYEPKPIPPPDVHAVFEAYRAEVSAKLPELDQIFVARVEERLGVVLQPRRRSDEAK